MNKNKTLKITYSAFFLCLALVLPFLTGQIKILGKMLNLMHVAVFLCGMVCGGEYGFIVGLTAPLLRSITFGMPVMYPNAIGMAFELGAYGLTSGLVFKALYNIKGSIFISLIASMLVGRIVWGIATLILYSFMGQAFTFALFIKGAFVDSVVGIVIHLIIIPLLVLILKKAKLILIDKE
ncbi:MAG: ECF transporter S component [Clostridiales bacterium]|nr:ECF transporter S component [Clostridiales bacterium]